MSGLFRLRILWSLFSSLVIVFQSYSISPDKLKFRFLTEENGLTNCYIYCIGQDHKGFIWIGTENGIYRYDGHRFKQFLNLPGDSTSLNSNVVFKIFSDSHHNLWIGTFIGLMRYDEKNDCFHDFNLQKYRSGLPVPINSISEDYDGTVVAATDIGIFRIDPETYKTELITASQGYYYKGKSISAFYTDRYRNHWIATEEGITKINFQNHQSTHYEPGKFAHKPFAAAHVHYIFQDSYDNIWISTRQEGLFMKPAFSEAFVRFYYKEDDKNSIGSNETYDIFEDDDRQIWISTNGGGLNLFNRQAQNFTRIKHSVNDKYSLLSNNIRSILEDRQGNLWIASFQTGVNVYVNHPQLFRYYDITSGSPLDYQSSIVCSVHQFDENKLWVGTDGGGLKLLDRRTGVIETFLPVKNRPGSFPDKVVMTIYRDRQQIFWFGTYQGGLVSYDAKNKKFITYSNNPNDPYSIASNFVTKILEDKKGNFWIGTNGGGLNLYDRSSGEFRSYQSSATDPNSLINNYINDIVEDPDGDLWIATYWGLSRFNTEHFTFINYLEGRDNFNSISRNTIFCVFVDSKKQLWVGTRNGLNLYNREKDNFRYFNQKGISGSSIYAIIEDEKGNLWISGNQGLICYNPENGEVTEYTESDGLQGKEFFRKSSYKSPKGELFFGGINGLNAFFPDQIKPREYTPEVIITGFKVFDKEVVSGKLPDGRRIHNESIGETKRIDLRHSDKIFTFEIAALDFITPENIIYAYRLEGFDNEWNYTTAQYPVITYTNLNPGEYTLHIKAGNKNIIDQAEKITKLAIMIKPPFWKTWWAYLAYVLLLAFITWYFWSLSMQRIKDKEQVRLEVVKREKLEELNQAKFRFFTNISHEFRTPLTLIISPLEQFVRKGAELQPYQKQIRIMLNNARRMLRLINQLLDFRKSESGGMVLKAENLDIVKFLRDVVHSFEEHALEKQINLKVETGETSFMLWFDPDKMDKILFNLLSNAFKFTPSQGSVTVEFLTGIKIKSDESEKEFVQISVSDTGPGIPEKDLPFIFERFYQAENASHMQQGSGLGLSLTKSFVELHHGKIIIDSSVQGTIFSIQMPVGDEHLALDQKLTVDGPGLEEYVHYSLDSVPVERVSEIKKKTVELSSKPTLLLVEDHAELRNFIEEECRHFYIFYAAGDGLEGYEMAKEILPDLIISDIMMPGLNGYNFCQKIKENVLTSHIPVILLTAKSSMENQIKGFEAGADAYISKPFRIDQLVATANAILENRIRLREKFNTGKLLANLPVKNTADDKFLQKVTDMVNTNISEVDFGVMELSREIGISRVHLHRKLKAIANISPNEFIKNIRLQQAVLLLQRKEFTISEICYKVGFNSPAYFSSCFRSYFQMSPTEYIERNSQA